MKAKKSSNITVLDLPTTPAPKPTKKEVVEAMVIRARQLHRQEQERRQAVRQDCECAALKLVIPRLVNRLKTLPDNFTHSDLVETDIDVTLHLNGNMKVEIGVEAEAELKRLGRKKEDNAQEHFWEDRVRKSITEAMKAPCNPVRLLDDPETSTLIDNLLNRIGVATPKLLK